MTTADDVRAQQRRAWDGAAAGWEKWDDVVMRMLAPVGEEMIRRLDIGEASQHLEVAAGTGEPGLTIAALAPRGRVVLTDLAPAMLAAAARLSAARGLANVEVRECSADDLPFADATFDSVGCRFGFMFFPDVATALAEFARVLRPGGRAVAAVWAEPAANPWVTTSMGAVATEVPMQPPGPDAPGIFRFAAPGVISAAFEQAGFRDVSETDVAVTQTLPSPEAYWDQTLEVAAPVAAAMAQVDDAARQRIRQLVIQAVRAFESEGMVRIPGLARVIVGTR